MSEVNSGNATMYEIINKVTGEIFPVTGLGSGDVNGDGTQDFITHKEDGEEVVFTNPGYQNETYVVRQVETHMSPDDKVLVEDIVPEKVEGTDEDTEEATA